MVSLRGLTLTAARPRIIVPLFARDPAALCPLAKAASANPAAELVELRLDPLPADEFLNALALVRGIVDKRYTDFDVRNFGFSKLTPFLESLDMFEIKDMKKDSSSPQKYVRLK